MPPDFAAPRRPNLQRAARMPKQKRASWRVKRPSRVKLAPSPSRTVEELPENMGETISATYPDGWTSTVPVEMKPVVLGDLAQMAALVWQHDYRLLFELEAEKLESSLGLVSSAMTLKEAVPQSTYARELQAKGEQPKRAHRVPAQAADLARAAYRQANQRHHTFKICARSLATLARRTPYSEWRNQIRAGLLLSRPTTIKLLKLAMACKPEPPFEETTAVQHFVFDQKYAKKGKSRAKHRGCERVDASGDLVALVSTVLVNMMRIPVPATLGMYAPCMRPPCHCSHCTHLPFLVCPSG